MSPPLPTDTQAVCVVCGDEATLILPACDHTLCPSCADRLYLSSYDAQTCDKMNLLDTVACPQCRAPNSVNGTLPSRAWVHVLPTTTTESMSISTSQCDKCGAESLGLRTVVDPGDIVRDLQPATFFESVQFAKLADLLNQTRSIDIFEKGGMPIANMFLRNLLLKSAYACTSPSMRQPNPADRERTDRNMNLLSTLPSFRYGEIGGLWFDTLLCVADATGARLSAPFRSEFGVDTIDPTNLLVHQYPKKGADDWTGMTEKEQVLFRIFYSSVAVRTFDKVYWSNTRYCTDCFEHAFDGLGSDHCVLTASSPLQHRPAYNYENDASVQEWFGTKTLDVFKDETVNAALFSPFESRDTPADLPPIALANLRRVAHAILRAQNKDVEDGDVASDVITRVQNLACHNQLRVFEGSDTTLCTIVDSRAISLPSVLLRMCIDRSHPDKGDPLVNPHGFSFFLDDHKKSVFMFCDMSVPAVHEIDKAFPITWHTVNGHQQVIKTAWTFAEMFVVGAFCWPNDDQVIPWPFNLSFLAASHFLCRRFLTHTNLILEVIVATVAHDFVAAAFKYFTE